MAKEKTVWYCTECGNEAAHWQGQCPACGKWNTLVEAPPKVKTYSNSSIRRTSPKKLKELDTNNEVRFSTGIGELDRVLGGGAVRGSIVLFGGEPGIGKSTLLLQVCGLLSENETILYVSGEESEKQIKMRADRLGIYRDKIYVLAGTDINEVTAAIDTINPNLVIIDSIQTIYDPEMTSTPGSVGQVKACAMEIMRMAKSNDFTAFVVGHVNKEGAIAGPKVLEHMVDCVIQLSGDGNYSTRILRSEKNRFGSTNEIGVFEMQKTGLVEVPNPSELMLSGRPINTPGTCVTCAMEGSRPILAEIQALACPTNFASGRRISNGFDYNRMVLLMAVLEKRAGLIFSGCDAYTNVIGGINLDEPAADLAACLAMASSFRDVALPPDLVALGEIGLTGEIRSIQALDLRLAEVARLGFKKCVIPAHIKGEIKVPNNLELIKVNTLRQAIELIVC